MRVKEARREAGLKQKDIAKALKAVEKQADESLVSKIEKGVCLPTPPQLKIICEETGKEPLELYDFKEIDLIGCMGAKTPLRTIKPEQRTEHRKITFRIYKDTCKSLNDDVLRACGYPNKQAWFYQCVKRLEAEHAARCKYLRKSETKVSLL
jgi:transcriptional regulator with XRE-family HTH domain